MMQDLREVASAGIPSIGWAITTLEQLSAVGFRAVVEDSPGEARCLGLLTV